MRGKILSDLLCKLSDKADAIKIAVAFFTDPSLINGWLERGLRVDLIVQLGLPTAPDALKAVRDRLSTEGKIRFFGPGFHAKVYLFLRSGSPFAATVGSSNSTPAGLSKNIEANVVVDSPDQLILLQSYFDEMWDNADDLEPEDLRKYEIYYKAARRPPPFSPRTGKTPERRQRQKISLSREAASYLRFWHVADRVRDMVKNISRQEWPRIPLYLTVDHFWHWVKIKWKPQDSESARNTNAWKETRIPELFKQYAAWDKNGDNYTKEMLGVSQQMQSLLSQGNIASISRANARWVYRNLHAGAEISRRFGRDEQFVKENELAKIRKTWRYLLWSDENIQQRISGALTSPQYRLRYFGSSAVQELVGWVRPNEMPMRNKKADAAVGKLGFQI